MDSGQACDGGTAVRQALHCTVVHCTVLHCTALHCSAVAASERLGKGQGKGGRNEDDSSVARHLLGLQEAAGAAGTS